MHRILNINDIQEYAHYLNEADEIKVNKYVKREDQLRAIGSIILQKDYIQTKYNLEFKDIVIQHTEFGKPYYKDLVYNVSHDSDLVVIVYSDSATSIGVDIMKQKSVNIYQFNNSFSQREKWDLNKDNFFRYWCAKEAFAKALGVGLSIDFASVEFIGNKIHYYGAEYKVEFIEIPFYVCIFVEI
jgi:4'-phosphopantetheinyl transferase